MNDSIILIISILVSAGIGAFIGLKFAQLKHKSDQSASQERQFQLNNSISELKTTIEKIETEREDIRREKEFLNTELSRRNTEFENLQQQNLKRDEELAKHQEQLRKDFELMASKILDEKSKKFTLQNKENIGSRNGEISPVLLDANGFMTVKEEFTKTFVIKVVKAVR